MPLACLQGEWGTGRDVHRCTLLQVDVLWELVVGCCDVEWEVPNRGQGWETRVSETVTKLEEG